MTNINELIARHDATQLANEGLVTDLEHYVIDLKQALRLLNDVYEASNQAYEEQSHHGYNSFQSFEKLGKAIAAVQEQGDE